MKQLLPAIIVFVLLLTGGAIFIATNSSNGSQEKSVSKAAKAQKQQEAAGIKLTLGNPSAPATVTEYMDYKCPVCGNFHQNTGKQINSVYVDNDQAKFDIIITPVIGPDSKNAGRGAYCSQEQSKFAVYHDAVMNHMWDNYYSRSDLSIENRNYLSTDKLVDIIKDTEIDTEVFKSCMSNKTYDTVLDNNISLASAEGVRGTPGFSIGGQSFVGIQPFSVYKTLIDIQLR